METTIRTLTIVDEHINNAYEFLLAISSDSLLVVDKNKKLIEWIIVGNDKNGVVACAETEDEFLDAIFVISKLIKSNINPLITLSFKR